MAKEIEFFFAVGSPWAYLGLEPLLELTEKSGATVIPRPMLLIEENGGIFSKNRPEPRRQYWLKELARWSKVRGKTLVMADRAGLSDPKPASFMIIAAALDGLDWARLTAALQAPYWSDKADIGQPETRAALADKAGFNGQALLAREMDADVQARWDENRGDALHSGIFGVPTFRYEGELYWGQDNLPFLERHLAGEKLVD